MGLPNISIVGVGRLGLCFALALERAGFRVLGVDREPRYIEKLNRKTFRSREPGVESRLKESTNFSATTDLREAYDFADILFIFVATPSLANHRFDHSQIEAVLENLPAEKPIVISATVMPTYTDSVAKRGFRVSYSPSFIAQGSVIQNILSPDFALIGESDRVMGDQIEEIYSKLCENDPPIHRMTPLSAEITKLSLNCFVTQKIAFANLIGDLAVRAGGDPEKILKAIGSDSRVGEKYFRYGYGYGGPCFPRDNRALSQFAKDMNLNPLIPEATEQSNQLHLEYQLENFIEKNPPARPLVLGPVTYNQKAASIEESQQLAFAVCLAKKGYSITIEDDAFVIEILREKYQNLFQYREKR